MTSKRFRAWIEGAGSPQREVSFRRLTTVQLVHYRQHLLGVERLKASTINRKIQALKKLFGWARQKGHVKSDVSRELQFVRVGERCARKGSPQPRSRRYCGLRVRPVMDWRSATTPCSRCCSRPGCGWKWRPCGSAILQPSHQAEMPRLITEIFIAMSALDFTRLSRPSIFRGTSTKSLFDVACNSSQIAVSTGIPLPSGSSSRIATNSGMPTSTKS